MEYFLNNQLNITLIAVVLLFTFMVLVTSILFYKTLSKLLTVLKKSEDKKPEISMKGAQEAAVYAKVTEIFEEARKQSMLIIQQSNEQAQKLLGEATEISSESKAALKSQLERVATSLEGRLQSQVTDFNQQLYKETVETQHEVDEKIKKKYDEVAQELEEHKKKKMAELDSGIFEILARVTKKVLGESLNLEQHQTLVLNALEEAKEEWHKSW